MQSITIDTTATQGILDFFAQCIEIKGPILVDQLFHLVTSKFSQDDWYKMFKTPSDLTTFLRIFSDCFHIKSNLVTLLQKPKLSNSHIQQAQDKSTEYYNSIHHHSKVKTSTPLSPASPSSEELSPSSIDDVVTPTTPSPLKCESEMGGVSYSETVLENLCERNCPTNCVPYSGGIYSSVNSAISGGDILQNQIEKAVIRNQSLRQRVNSLVIKTLAENKEKDKMNSAENHHHQIKPYTAANNFVGDTWKLKILQNTRVITNIKDSIFVTDAISKFATLKQQVVISLDCEGVNVGSKGTITLIQVGTSRGEAFIFDVQECPEIVGEGGLKSILEDENVIKIIHDCRNDSVNLWQQFGIVLRSVFDTQVAHAVLQYQVTGKQVYKAKYVSLNTLCENYHSPLNPIREQLRNAYRKDQKFWSRRPFTRDMLLYAAGDVLVLINEKLFLQIAQ